jgi:hypothetical protein
MFSSYEKVSEDQWWFYSGFNYCSCYYAFLRDMRTDTHVTRVKFIIYKGAWPGSYVAWKQVAGHIFISGQFGTALK